jgi:hypothetical protein
MGLLQIVIKGQTTSHGFAVDLIAGDLLATQRICLQHVCSKSPACCRLAVDLSVLNYIQRICWQHNIFVCNISTRQDVVDKSVGGIMLLHYWRHNGFAVDLL